MMDYFAIYKDIWEFHKKYIDFVSHDDAFWELVIDDANKIIEKYGNTKFVKDIVLAELMEFDRIIKEGK